MFIVIMTYTKPLDVVEHYLKAHRDYLEEGYQKNYLIASGPKVPRVGGILLSQLAERKTLEDFLAHDPFHVHHVSTYELIEFTPVKYHPEFASFIS